MSEKVQNIIDSLKGKNLREPKEFNTLMDIVKHQLTMDETIEFIVYLVVHMKNRPS